MTRIRQHSAARVHDGLSGDWVPIEELTALELFKSTKRPFKVKLASNFAPKPDSNEPAIKAAVRRVYEKGAVICEAGAYGSTAFLLLEGSATAFVPETMRAATVPGRSRSSRSTLARIFRRRSQAPAAPRPAPAEIGEISAYATLARTREATPTLLRAGDLFGIDTCVNFYPRETTVRAEERCVAIEMLRSVLDTIRDAGSAGPAVEDNYARYAIGHEVEQSVLLAECSAATLAEIAAAAELLTPDSDQVRNGVLYEEGAPADAVFLVRSGTIKLARTKAGGELILTYVGRGGAFGLESLAAEGGETELVLRCTSHPELAPRVLGGPITIGRSAACEVALPAEDRSVGRRHCRIEDRGGTLHLVDLESANGTLVNGTRVQDAAIRTGDRITVVSYTFEVARVAAQTVSATRVSNAGGLDNFEVVRIPADLAKRALASGGPLPSASAPRQTGLGGASAALPAASAAAGATAVRAALDAATAPRGAAEQALLNELVALNLYNSQNALLIDLDRCTRCDECVRACATAHGGIARFTRDGPRFGKYLVTMACRSCTDPKCMIGCPVGSIRRRDSLEVQIEDWCIGCQRCANQCPFGNINMVELASSPGLAPPVTADVTLRATVCDLCAGYDEPNCVYACPHDATIRVKPGAFLSVADLR